MKLKQSLESHNHELRKMILAAFMLFSMQVNGQEGFNNKSEQREIGM